MKEWWVWFERTGSSEEEVIVVLPSFWKVLRWFLLEARKCDHIVIFTREDT